MTVQVRQVSLESVITTAELARRPARSPDFEAESIALTRLMHTMAAARGTAGAVAVLQQLVEIAVVLCRAHSAGVSLLETEDGQEVFRWRAATGAWARFLGQSMPRESSPCGTVLDRNASVLMAYPERHFFYEGEAPPIVETMLVPFHYEGKPVGTVWIIAHDETRKFDAEDQRLLMRLTSFAAAAYQLLVTQNLRLQLADARLMQSISAELIVQDNMPALYEKLLDAVVTVMASDFASYQLYHDSPGGAGELKLLACRGFTREAARFWETVRIESHSACGEALRTRRRVIVPDAEQCDFLAESDDLAVFRQTGIRSVQTTPLWSRTGKLVGMISTHWRRPHEPSERDLLLLDVLARQAADLLEQKRADDAMQEADHRKDVFLATLGHELRNPLAPVRHASEILRTRPAGSPDAIWAANVIDRQVKHMTRLIDDLLDLGRITHDKLELRRERFDLATVVQRAVETTAPSIDERRQDLSVTLPEKPLYLDADSTRIAQVISNLLDNASKFSERGGRIELSTRREDHFVVIAVRDFGRGIARDMLPGVFDYFNQGMAGQDSGAGMGIGLGLVKRIVEMHGGRVAAKSAGPGKGSEFEVRLPVACTDAGPALKVNRRPLRAPRVRRVLVVDDSQDSATSLGKMLDGLGYETHTAFEGDAGLEAAARLRPDIALVDVSMPNVDGYAVARGIRAHPWGKKTLLIAVTGWGGLDDRHRTKSAGFDYHLVKPVDPVALASLLASSS